MFRKKTVLVLGAGSSVEFKLPVGERLAKNIAEMSNFQFEAGEQINGDRSLYNSLIINLKAHDIVMGAGRRISEGLPLSRSIDDFLYNHGHDPAVVLAGKAGIVQGILTAEAESTLFQFRDQNTAAQRDSMAAHAGTWIYKFFGFIQTGVRFDNIDDIFDGLSIINFNYDRCVEYFLFHALKRAYGLSFDDAARVMKKLDITHPYGQVGQLPWQSPDGSGIDFGERLEGSSIVQLAREIKTFTEQAHDEKEKGHWRNTISQCDQLVFMGFGFHSQNVDLLSLKERPQELPKIYGTSYKASIPDRNVFERRIYNLMNAPFPENWEKSIDIELSFANCEKMISEFGLHLFT